MMDDDIRAELDARGKETRFLAMLVGEMIAVMASTNPPAADLFEARLETMLAWIRPPRRLWQPCRVGRTAAKRGSALLRGGWVAETADQGTSARSFCGLAHRLNVDRMHSPRSIGRALNKRRLDPKATEQSKFEDSRIFGGYHAMSAADRHAQRRLSSIKQETGLIHLR